MLEEVLERIFDEQDRSDEATAWDDADGSGKAMDGAPVD